MGEYSILVLGAVLAMTSKYIFAYARRHIFNPIAIALLILDLLGGSQAFWWVGAASLLPIVIIVGVLIVMKIRRFEMFIPFLVAAVLMFVIKTGISSELPGMLKSMVLSGPIIFFGTIMLTEPQTSPHRRKWRIVFAIIVGVLFNVTFALGPLYSSPEFALIVGNLFAFAISPKQRIRLVLLGSVPQGDSIYEFFFRPDRELKYIPGQYMEWTLTHKHVDSRGDRRYFTIASSPSEPYIKLVVRIDPDNSSSFKRALLAIRPGDEIWASQLSGDFVLPTDTSKRVVFIAGGIGITPIRSIVRQLIDTNQRRDMALFYASSNVEGFSYWQIFDQAVQNGLRPYYFITGDTIPQGWPGKTGRLTEEIIKNEVPGYKQPLYYLSGPNAMVASYKRMLFKAGVPRGHIKTDYFPGF